jgi:hypothetical protein
VQATRVGDCRMTEREQQPVARLRKWSGVWMAFNADGGMIARGKDGSDKEKAAVIATAKELGYRVVGEND